MLGKYHIRTNTAVYIGCASLAYTADKWAPQSINRFLTAAGNVLKDDWLANTLPEGIRGYLLPILFFIPFYLGGLLPDIDQKNSVIGKYLHIPFRHRGFTHSVWFALLFGVPGYLAQYRWLLVIAAGCLLHDFTDMSSSAGVALFYPLGRGYRKYPNGAFRAVGHKFWLYETNTTSEKRLSNLIIILNAACVCAAFYFAYIWK